MTLVALEHIQDQSLKARVCIIGAGAAGIALACELDGAPFSVLLIEAGGLHATGLEAQQYSGDATPPHPDPVQFRRIAFGGTTALWGGRCVALDPLDLQSRPHVANSGWPIGYEDLARHYPRAMSYCDAGDYDFTLGGSLQRPQPTISGFDGDGVVVVDRIERYSLPTDFGKRYRRKISESRNVSAILGARCSKLIKQPGDDRIASAEVIDAAGRKLQVQAEIFVLATGGIEVPRLLMLSDPQGSGLGNRSDCLGRYYQCHFENTAGRLVPHEARVAFYFERTTDGVYCRRQLRFSPETLAQHRLLNMAFRLHFPSYGDAGHGSAVMSAIYLAKSLLVPEYRAILQHNADTVPSPALPHVRNVLGDLPGLARFAGDWLFRIRLAERKLPYTLVPNADGSFPLEFNSEQTPVASNRVLLAPELDSHGLRRVRIEWRLSEQDADSAYRGFVLLRDTMNRHGSCKVEFDDNVLRDRLRRSPPLGGHHIGTARMAAAARGGVVDSNCAVFDLPNLFIASSAVFPTSGNANPTLTIVAMAVRLAAHLRDAER
ncbi:MAG: GMC oxidoreductase [Steroidobacteraceae bacterium]